MTSGIKSKRKSNSNRSLLSEIRSDPVTSFSSRTSRIAPRSGLQFKVGPLFQQTIEVSPLYIKKTEDRIRPILESRIDRGFELIDGDWIGYKRNYISVVSSFKFKEFKKSTNILQEHGFYIITKNQKFDVCRFAIRLVGKSVHDSGDVSLIQNTAKRDKGPILEPPVVPVIPGSIPKHDTIREGSNIRNKSKIKEFELLFVQDYKSLQILQPGSILRNYPINENYNKVAKFERIQFISTIPNKKSVYKNKKFILQIQLLAQLDDSDTYAIIAISNTPSVFIRANGVSRYEADSLKPNNSSPLSEISNMRTRILHPFQEISKDLPEDGFPKDTVCSGYNGNYYDNDDNDDDDNKGDYDDDDDGGGGGGGLPLIPGCQTFSPFNSSRIFIKSIVDPYEDDDPELLDPKYFLEKSRVTKIHELTSSYLNETFSSSFLRPFPRLAIQVLNESIKQSTNENYDNNSTGCISPYLLTKI